MIVVDGIEIRWAPGLTVAELLSAVDADHRIAVVRLNGRLVSRPHFETTPVPDGAEVVLIPMIAGG